MGQHRERVELARSQFKRALGRLHEVAALEQNDILRDSLVGRISRRRNPPDGVVKSRAGATSWQ